MTVEAPELQRVAYLILHDSSAAEYVVATAAARGAMRPTGEPEILDAPGPRGARICGPAARGTMGDL
jgi:hypothetical protein